MLCSRSGLFVRVVVCLLACLTAASAQSGLLGKWKEPTGSVIEVTRCGSDVCMRLISISSRAPTQRDERNPDQKLRSRPLCGLQIGSGFHLEGDEKAEGGSLYDPKSGRTYKGSMTRMGDELHLRGYVGFKLFGVTETWVRTAPTTPCTAPAP